MSTGAARKRSPLTFFVLVFVLALPFWVLGALVKPLPPINLSLSSLQIVCPVTTALILVYREERLAGIRRLLKRVFDANKMKHHPIWYVPILFLNPFILLLSYWIKLLLGHPIPQPFIPWSMIPFFFVVFFFSATCEEIGWTGYATDPLQERWSALSTGLIIGSVWALWHIVGWKQEQPWAWVAGQCFLTIGLRVLMVWLYNNTSRSMFAVILFHTMINVSEFSFPNYGSYFDPLLVGTITAVLVVIVAFFWGPKTLARFRYASSYF
ncbi:MAG TPA: CPBP family intramembrane glutamic endopeptidase [Ktedonobacteraceae bacterium]|nr:CPBP family intramembrane glutamic endopeptidase [Ktedonobacteraceae bacterium]